MNRKLLVFLSLSLISSSTWAHGGSGSWSGSGGDGLVCYADKESARELQSLVKRGETPSPARLDRADIVPLDLSGSEMRYRKTIGEKLKNIFWIEPYREAFRLNPEFNSWGESRLWARLLASLRETHPQLAAYLGEMRSNYPISHWQTRNSLRDIADENRLDRLGISVIGGTVFVMGGAAAAAGSAGLIPAAAILLSFAPFLLDSGHRALHCQKMQIAIRRTGERDFEFFGLSWAISRMSPAARVGLALHEYLYALSENLDCRALDGILPPNEARKFARRCEKKLLHHDSSYVRRQVSRMMNYALGAGKTPLIVDESFNPLLMSRRFYVGTRITESEARKFAR